MTVNRALAAFVLLTLCVAQSGLGAKRSKEVSKLQIGVKHKPAECSEVAKAGDTVSVHYQGSLVDGTIFDASYDRGEPISFILGQGQVIKGWDQGISGMCVGEKRKLKIPSHLGYGSQGSPPKIPGGATLIFETELVDIIHR